MKRIDAINTIRMLEEKHNIKSIMRDNYSIYQLISVPVTMNLITTEDHRTTEGRLNKLKDKYTYNDDVVKGFLSKKNMFQTKSSEESVLFMLRGKFNERGEDILLHEYYEYYKKQTPLNVLTINRKLDGKLAENIYPSDYTTNDFKYLSKTFANNDITELTCEEQSILNDFEHDLISYGYTGMNMIKLLKMKLRDFYCDKINYKLYLTLNKVEKVYLTLGYVHQGLIHAARELDIPVIEIQYANISNLHPGYSFSYTNAVTSDYLITWGSMYGSDLENNNSKIIYKRPDFLKNSYTEKKNQILVVVQKIEYLSFEPLIELLSLNNIGIPIIFKMPLGISFTKNFIEKLHKYDIQISYGDDPKSAFDYIKESKWVISGYSTALIESLSQNSITISYQKIPNSEEFYPYIENKMMHSLKEFDVSQYELNNNGLELFQEKDVREVVEKIEEKK